jgi:predicted nucleic acid-binding protein
LIAADTSTWVAFLQGERAEDTQLLDRALADHVVLMVPPVLTELLTYSDLSSEFEETLLEIPLVDTQSGYWQRAGALRARVLSKRRRARLGDALIAQSCIDHGISLITRDKDFRAFAEAASLTLFLEDAPLRVVTEGPPAHDHS